MVGKIGKIFIAASLVLAWAGGGEASGLDALDDVTMQVIDADEDLTKAMPRVIEIPAPASRLSRPDGKGARARSKAEAAGPADAPGLATSGDARPAPSEPPPVPPALPYFRDERSDPFEYGPLVPFDDASPAEADR